MEEMDEGTKVRDKEEKEEEIEIRCLLWNK